VLATAGERAVVAGERTVAAGEQAMAGERAVASVEHATAGERAVVAGEHAEAAESARRPGRAWWPGMHAGVGYGARPPAEVVGGASTEVVGGTQHSCREPMRLGSPSRGSGVEAHTAVERGSLASAAGKPDPGGKPCGRKHAGMWGGWGNRGGGWGEEGG
jgi:hypothetical protein